ncbi:agamous-like MADS-box protein AGL65 isoform X2 [Prosopis cineraria]|uniref:agamous-like MADS-box protein AGL65 isoform X2 n=1 Tax=Prosopis cineraria TaxID=364024 RepID=UPI00240EB663|nr:agamous-like MADS-box protein AGL65 isoform X2 [Prosopis cineraria]
MGRVKLKIKKLESISNRQVTFSKRKSGILKKAKELSILCDIDIALLMFSPTGKPILLQGERSNLEEVIEKFAQLSPQERAKRKLESLEALKKTFKKLDHDVKIQDFLGSSQQVEELTHHLRVLQAQLAEVHQRLSYWNNVEKINNVEHLRQMEDLLRELINRVCLRKENLGKHQLMSLDCTNQLQEGITLPLMMASLQEAQPLAWLLNNDNSQLILPSEPKFIPFSDNLNRDAECSINVSLPSYSGYISTAKLEVGNSPHVATLGQGSGGTLNEFNEGACLSTQRCEQFSYPPPLDSEEQKHHPTMNGRPSPVDYQVNNSFDLPKSIFENGHQFWNSTSTPCGIAMYNENGYHQ